MNYMMMWDVCGIWDSPIERPVSAEFLYALNPEGSTFVSNREGDPVLVQYVEDDGDWTWDIYERA